jgi:hypothetical protein
MVTGRRFRPPWHVVEHAGNRLIRPAPAATPNLEERTGLTIPEARLCVRQPLSVLTLSQLLGDAGEDAIWIHEACRKPADSGPFASP